MKTLQLLLIAILIPFSSPAADKPAFPKACQENCVSPFGTVLGKTSDGVEAYSNCSSKCVYENPSMVQGNFAGIEWQCVEFARRWLMTQKHLTYPSIDVAADLWNKVDHLIDLQTKKDIPLTNILNGARALPKKGDLLIYGREYLDTGHVAIVLRVDTKKKLVYVAEENFTNSKWPGNYSRSIPYANYQKTHWLLDAHLIGWKSY